MKALKRQEPTQEAGDPTVEQVLNSWTFRKAPALRALLRYLWDHRNEELSEYAIAVDVFSRPAGFDPKLDSTVRVQIARLRQKLKQYYELEGQGSPQRLTIPLGQHRIEVAACPGSDPSGVPRVARLRRAVIGLASATALLAVACAGLLLRESPGPARSPSQAQLPSFWVPFFAAGTSTRLVLENPVFFRWDNSFLKVRDVRVNEFGEYANSDELLPLLTRYGRPKLMQNYTATSDTFAALRLVQYLGSLGCQVSVVGSASWSTDLAEESNLILAGTAGVNRRFRGLWERLNFVPVEADDRVLNRNPWPGERAEYVQVFESPKRRVAPGLIAVLPLGSRPNRALALIGVESVALANFVTSSSGLSAIEKTLREHGSPQFFEAVAEAEVDAGTVLNVNLVAFRPVTPTH